MARRKKNDRLLVAIGLFVGGALAVAPFVMLYLGCRAGPRLTKHLDDYSLTSDEALQLSHSSMRRGALDAQHRGHLSSGLLLTKSGEFDRRSNAGKIAYEVSVQLAELEFQCRELRGLPLNRLTAAISFTKLRESARFAIAGFIAWFAYAATYMLGPNFGWPSAYFLASVVGLGVFAVVWLWFTFYYWAGFSQLRMQLRPQSI